MIRISCVLTASLVLAVCPSWADCLDADVDGFGVNGDPSCPGGPYPDCDDTNGAVYPGAPEVCDGVNNDCDHPWWPSLVGSATEQIISASADRALSVFAADVDGDLNTDVLSASYDDDKIAWYENTAGDGSTWTEQVISTSALGAASVFSADVDGDSDMDVLSASYNDATIAWYENTLGDGTTWTERVISTSADGAFSVFAADLDGDLDMDVLSASELDDKIAWYENTSGDGTTWTEHVISTSALGAVSVFAADVDGDLDADVLYAAHRDDKIAWYENASGDGTTWTEHVISTSADRAFSVFAADVDGDSDMDAVSASFYDDKIAWYENTSGNGTTWTEHVISTSADGASSVFAADVDGDSDMDILSASHYDSKIAWYENLVGNGSMWTERVVSTIASLARSVHAADVDGDSDLDVLSASEFDDKIAWYETVSFEADDDGDGLADCAGDCDDGNPNCTTDCTDADGDGYCVTHDCDEGNPNCTWDCMDDDGDGVRVCDGDCDDANDSVYPGAPEVCDGVNNDCDHPWWPSLEGWADEQVNSTPANGALSVFAADVDGDDDADILSASRYDAKIAWYENTPGDGSIWSEHEISTSTNGASSVFAADVDGDNDVDVLSASEWDAKIAWYENTAGDGTSWTGHVISTSANNAWSVFAADVDGDNDMDVLSASQGDAKIAWYENTAGDGTSWTEHVISTSANGARSVFAADVDGDNDVDVLSASRYDDKIAWYENTAGDGTSWTEHEISTSADLASSVFAADVDGDNDMDVLSASQGDNKIAWYENTSGDGTSWTEHVISTSASGAMSVFAADVDGDSKMDVLSASYFGNKIAWYENTAGDGSTWAENVISTSAVGAWSVFAVDVDGDSETDVLSASFDSDTITWYKSVSLEADDDGDGLADCDGDCDDGNSFCTTDCTDGDGDGYCVGHDCDDTIPSCTTDCVTNDDGDPAIACADCDDGNAAIYPGAPEVCDGVNNDCDDPLWPSLVDWVVDRTISASADGARSVFSADVDGDSDLDVLSASSNDHTIAWYDNTSGDGTSWTEHAISTSADGATSVFAADVDGDDDMDVLSASRNDDKIAWYENASGDGSAWTEHVISTSADWAVSVFAADVDGDADMDVLSASWNDDKIAWYENTSGDGSNWTEHAISTSADGAASVLAADLDGDSDLDVLSASWNDDKIAWYENTAGDGSTWLDHAISTSAEGAEAVFAADVDGDLDVDVLSASANDDTIAWYENKAGDGLNWLEHVISISADGALSVFAADMDGDLDLDVLSASLHDDKIAWYGNTAGDGSTWTERVISTPVDGVTAVFGADVDGDTDMDILSASSYYDTIAWYEAASLEIDDDGDGLADCDGDCDDGNPNCTTDCTDGDGDGYCVTHDCDDTTPSCTTDCVTNEDNDPAIACLDCDDANGAVYPGAPEVCDGVNNDCDHPWWPSLDGWTESTLFNFAGGAWSVFGADVDGDSDADVLSAWSTSDKIQWFDNTSGDGSTWTRRAISVTNDGARSVFGADIDGDDDLDVVAASSDDDKVAWYENTAGDGSAWTEHVISTSADGAWSVFAADVDGDDDLDVLSASFEDNKISWYENTTGDGSTWSERQITTSANGALSVFAADVDGDDDMDVLSASNYDNKIAWYENTSGDGLTWTEHVISATADNVWSVHAADVDGDGDLDAVSAYAFKGWFENTSGDGSTWTEHVISSSANGFWAITADVDNDNDLDVLSGPTLDGEIAWYENVGGDGLAWTEWAIPTSADVAASAFATDIDGDSDVDVLSASPNDNRIALYENDSVEPDADGDGLKECEGDCDDANPHCTTDCTDVDVDGYCVTTDCDDTVAGCTVDCTDADGDGLALCAGDCDDGNPNCTTDCTDADADGYCVTTDCDDFNPECTTDCTDEDADGYCVTTDCDDTEAECTVDCTDADEDGLAVCAGDCDDSEPNCTTDCTDADADGVAVCAGDCDDSLPFCTFDCTDADEDGWCVGFDCDDSTPDCTDDCTDADGDGLRACEGDCDDGNPNCTADCTDADGDGWCMGFDCDESNPYCTEDCTDADADGYCVDFDCDDFNPGCVGLDCADSDGDGFAGCEGDCDDTNAAVYPGQPEVCTDTLDNDCDGFTDASDARCSGLVATELSFASHEAMSWTAASSADSYGLYRGTIAATGWSGYDHLCEASELADTVAVDPDVPPLGEGFYYLANGQNLDIPADDFAGGPLGTGPGTTSRPDSDTIPCGPRVYVDPDVIDGDGLSWATAYSSVGTALTHESFTDRGLEIWAQGEAAERNSNPQAQRPGIRILGGFAGTETASWERSPETTPTIWDGGLAGGNPLIQTAGTSVVLDGLTMQSAVSALVGDPAGRLIELTDVRLEGITDYAVDLVFEHSGESKLIVRDVTFDFGGLGGLRATSGAGVLRGQIRDSVFLGHSDTALRLEARPVASAEVSLEVVGNTISGGNTGIVLSAYLDDVEATAIQSSFLGSNVIYGTSGSPVVVEAGGHFVFATGPALADARPILTGNTLSDGGAAGVQCTVIRTGVQENHEIHCIPELWHNLITFNADAGIAESADDPATGLISDPVVVGNGLFGNLAAYLDEGSQYLTVGEVNDLAGAYANFTGDPLFEDRLAGDYHLQPGTVLGFGSGVRYLANQSDPGLDLSWTEPLFDATDWSSGSYGIGYELEPFPGAARLLLTVVPAGTSSVYTRLAFEVPDASEIQTLTLGADYDDGYVVWLNGAEVYRSPSMPAGPPDWNATPAEHESSNGALPIYSEVNVTAAGLPFLVTGTNVLAVGVWNESAGSPDLVLVPRLTLNEDSPAIDTAHLEAPQMAGEDMDGEVRNTDGNLDGVTRPDAGADER